MVGMGLDCTCTGVEVPHPTDATAPNLPPQPVLLVSAGSCTWGGVVCPLMFSGEVACLRAVLICPLRIYLCIMQAQRPQNRLTTASALFAHLTYAGSHLRWRVALLHLWPHGLECRRSLSLCGGAAPAAAAPAAAAAPRPPPPCGCGGQRR